MDLTRASSLTIAVALALIGLSTGCGQNELSAPAAGEDTLRWYKKQFEQAVADNDARVQVQACGKIGDYFDVHTEYDSARLYYLKSAHLANSFDLTHEEVTGLGMAARLSDTEEAKVLLDSALALSNASSDPKDIAFALQEMGFYYYNIDDYPSALFYFREELKYDRMLNDSVPLASCISNIANIHSQQGYYDSSIVGLRKAIEIAQALHKDTNVAEYSYNLGLAYKEFGSYDTAMEYLLNAARFFDQDSMRKKQAACYNTLGNIHTQLGNLNKALEYHTLSYELRKQVDYQRGIAMSLTNIGEVYIRKSQYDSAMNYIQRSLELKERLGETGLIASSLDLFGECYYFKENFPLSEEYYRRSLNSKRQANDPKGTAVTLNKLVKLYIAWNKPDSALKKLEEGRAILAHAPAKEALLDNYELSIHVYRSTGHLNAALNFSEEYARLQDTLLREQNSTALAEMQTIYDLEKKDNEIDVLYEREKTQVALVDRQNKFIWSLVAGAAILLGFLALSAYALRTRKTALKQDQQIIAQQQTIIDQKQTMIDQKHAMMGELHHRVKNNLQILSTMLDLQQKHIADPEARELIHAVEHRLHAMILVHKKLYGNDARSEVKLDTYLDQLLKDLASSLAREIQAKGIALEVEAVSVPADMALSIGFICTELITNAFKYAVTADRKFELHVTLHHEKDILVLVIADNGQGIPSGVNVSSSSSFGLQLVAIFVSDLKADLSVASSATGTSFRLTIPHKKQEP